MESTVEKLAKFTCGSTFENMDKEAAREIKRLTLDSVGCALAGVGSNKGSWGLDYGRMFYSGENQAGVIGSGERFSAMGAVFANAELINALDYDASGKHIPPFVLPVCMAGAEMNRRSGAEMLSAFAVGLEIGTRIGKAMGSYRDIKDGKVVGLPPVTGHSCSVFGGAAAAAKLEGFSAEKTAQAMGLAGLISPANTQTPMHRDLPTNSGKYLLAGWAAQTGMTAAYLVKCGHRGDKNVLDGEYGYWRFIGAGSWNGERVTEELGEKWMFIRNTPMKRYPCCRMMHGGLQCLEEIIGKYSIRPEEIEHIHAGLEPTSAEPVFANRVIENQIDAQFSVAYNMAVTALGIKPGREWQSAETMKDARVAAMMDKVSFAPHAGSADALKADANSRISSVTLTARGQTFTAESRYIKGTVTDDPSTAFTDEELKQKFLDNAANVLSDSRAREAYDMLNGFENVKDVGELIRILH